MEMSSFQIAPAPMGTVWAALNDSQLLRACITGCENFEPIGDNAYKIAMVVKVGPVNAKFAGTIRLADLNPPESYTLSFEGQGGVAGFAKGRAQVRLSAEDGGTKLAYTASAQVGGKMAQVGSRLVDGTANKLVHDFFAAFTRELEARVKLPERSLAALAPLEVERQLGCSARLGPSGQNI